MEGKVLAGIFDRMAKNMRHVRGGVPDLVVWNTESKKFRVSAVSQWWFASIFTQIVQSF